MRRKSSSSGSCRTGAAAQKRAASRPSPTSRNGYVPTRSRRNVVSLVVLGLAAAGFAVPAGAQSTGYAGAAFGKAKSHVACPAGASCDDDAGAWKIFLGGRADDNFGGEISFVQTQDFARTGGELNMRALNFAALAGIPLSSKSWVFGKAGILVGHTEIGSGNGDGWGASLGVGAMLSITQKLALRLDWDRYRLKMPPVGNDRENIDMLTIGAQYGFGR